MAISTGGLTRVLVPKLGGEQRAALVGLLSGAAVYTCYAFAPYGWVLYVGILGWGLAAMSWPRCNAAPATSKSSWALRRYGWLRR